MTGAAIAEALEAARALLAAARPFEPLPAEGDPLAALLYDRWFHATTGARRHYPAPSAYRAVALAARPFEPGWTIEAALPSAAGAVRLRRDGAARDVPPLAWSPVAAPRLSPAPGEAALAAPLRDGPQGGFWHLWSPVWPERPPIGLRRWYLQVADGAELGAAATLAARAPAERAWAAKLLAGEHLAGRRDTAVFYAPLQGAPWLAALFEALAPQLADRAGPPFTEPLSPGIARAEDPGRGLSFGQHRCGLLAAAARARPEALEDAAAWREAVSRHFAEQGLDLASPWKGGTDG